jgi:hypothetical protein
VGDAVFKFLKRGRSMEPPKDIKMKDRTFKRARRPKGEEITATPVPDAAAMSATETDVKDRPENGRAEWLEWSSPQ